MHDKVVSSSSLLPNAQAWQNILAKFVLLFFGIALWMKWMSMSAGFIVALVWILDNGHRRLGQIIKEPLVLAILILCAALALGILWGDYPESGRLKWRRYFALLVFIPFLSLLNKDRLPWAIGGLVSGYAIVLMIGIYQCVIAGEQGIPPLDISYLTFSSMLGIGIIISIYLAGESNHKKIKSALWFLTLLLLYVQFNQHGRGPLVATLLGSGLLIFLRYKSEKKVLLSIAVCFIITAVAFAYSGGLYQRLAQVQTDIELSQQGKYDTSLGYRFAVWDVGLHGIAEKPLFGHGTGVPEGYFEKTVMTYKGGIYKDLPKYMETSHYHNDWIEIGMHLGAFGLLVFAFLLRSWFQTLKAHSLSIPGAALVCFIFISGLTDTFALYTKVVTFLLVITAVAIVWQKKNMGEKTWEYKRVGIF
ncbi:O-antigen ligase family protein [Nitrosovibrio tenuis]|uniref:O-antigen ligase n=1 Tax=Nitrosovibrio tenuis TaxID=1233 RepID=A0A1H7PIJ9_9PROT|nr:O-antigen ligase family protein [Nitrosovibrio tenuis]SEL35610.1 O-antigen ligase [Nitrosovibrio tenuis]